MVTIHAVATQHPTIAATIKQYYAKIVQGAPVLLPALTATESLRSPIPPSTVLRDYSESHPFIEFAVVPNQPIQAVAAGTVERIEHSEASNWLVYLSHDDEATFLSIYSSLGEVKVRLGQSVQEGETIGTMSATSGALVERFSFALRNASRYVNPRDVILFD